MTSWDWCRTCCQAVAQLKQTGRRQTYFSLKEAEGYLTQTEPALVLPTFYQLKPLRAPLVYLRGTENHLLEKGDGALDLSYFPGLSFQNHCLSIGCLTHPKKEFRIIPQQIPCFPSRNSGGARD